MTKILSILIFLLLILPGFAKEKKKLIPISKLPEDLQLTLKLFNQAVMGHDTGTVMTLLDRDYRAHEWDTYLKKDTPHFLNNFFCGVQVGTDQRRCIIFGDISLIKVTEVEKKRKNYKVSFLIKTKERDITTTLEFMGKKRIVYGAVGSTGFTQLGGM